MYNDHSKVWPVIRTGRIASSSLIAYAGSTARPTPCRTNSTALPIPDGLDRDPAFDAGGIEDMVHQHPVPEARREIHEVFLGQISQRDRLPASEPVLGRDREDPRHREQLPAGQVTMNLPGDPEEAHIDVPVAQCRQHPGRFLSLDPQL
jgi:hypothetical protein